MNLFGLHILTKSQVAALKAFGLSELDKAIVAAKQTELGATVASAIHAAEQTGKSGPEKLTDVLAVVTPAVLDYAAKGGFPLDVRNGFGPAILRAVFQQPEETALLTLRIVQPVLKLADPTLERIDALALRLDEAQPFHPLPRSEITCRPAS